VKFTDGKGREWTLTRVAALYLAEGRRRRLVYGWGGLRSTLTVRLLEERGLITLARSHDPDRRWEITGLTRAGEALLDRWNAKHNPLPDLPEETVPATKTDPRDIAYDARRARGVLFGLIMAGEPRTARALRLGFDLCHETQVVPDWPGLNLGGGDRAAYFEQVLAGLVAAGDAVETDGRYAPAERHRVLWRAIENAGENGVRQHEIGAAYPEWSDPAELGRALEIAREAGFALRPHERGRHYCYTTPPTEYVEAPVSYSARAQKFPLVEADDHR
jgi:hypothetical protein